MAALNPSGYSGTPLARKLGIREGSRVYASGEPEHYVDLLGPLPEGASIVARLSARADVIHIFATSRRELAKSLRAALKRMRPDAAIWVSWPKRAANVKTDIVEDVIRQVALPLGLVDVKVCAVDERWSGLKLVVRKANRPALANRARRRESPPR